MNKKKWREINKIVQWIEDVFLYKGKYSNRKIFLRCRIITFIDFFHG